ncbi:hypothetical protein K474DRAFT_1704857 [Panus rudis PR-1116 ss-1]|nr:hypothetical protein K474DRAFT_1704857 [Panus rudis PR-1116 ss-1]
MTAACHTTSAVTTTLSTAGLMDRHMASRARSKRKEGGNGTVTCSKTVSYAGTSKHARVRRRAQKTAIELPSVGKNIYNVGGVASASNEPGQNGLSRASRAGPRKKEDEPRTAILDEGYFSGSGASSPVTTAAGEPGAELCRPSTLWWTGEADEEDAQVATESLEESLSRYFADWVEDVW